MKLDTKPSDNVTINLRSTDPGEGIISASKLTFTLDNYSDSQTVTVTGVDDTLADGNQSYKIQLLPITGSGSGYDQDNNGTGYDPPDVNVINVDDELSGPGIVLNAIDVSSSESGDNGSFSVSLKTEPSALVIIPVAIDDNSTSEASINPSTFIFTPTNWNNPQTITVSGKDDNFIDGDRQFGVNLHQIISSDSDYRNIPTSTVDNNTRLIFTNFDNDSAGFIVNVLDNETDERLNHGLFSIRLKSRPLLNDNVSLDVMSYDDNSTIALLCCDNVSPSQYSNYNFVDNLSLFFDNNTHTADNWTNPFYIAIRGNNDYVRDGDNYSKIYFNLNNSTL